MRSILKRRRGRAAAAAAVTAAALIGVIPLGGAAMAAPSPAEVVLPAEYRADPYTRLPIAGLTGFLRYAGGYTWISYADGTRTPLDSNTGVPYATGSDVIAWGDGYTLRLYDPTRGTTQVIDIPNGLAFKGTLGTSAITTERSNPDRWHLLTRGEDGVTDKALALPPGATNVSTPSFKVPSPYGFLLRYTLNGVSHLTWVDSTFTAKPANVNAYGTSDDTVVAGTYLFRRYPNENRLRIWDVTGDFSAPVHEMDWAGGTPVALVGDQVLARVTAESGGDRLVARPLAGGADVPVLDRVVNDTPVSPDGRVIAVRAEGIERTVHAIQAGLDGAPPAVTKITDIPPTRTRLETTTLAQGVLQTYGTGPGNTGLLTSTELATAGDPTAGARKELDNHLCGSFDCTSIVPTGDGRSVLLRSSSNGLIHVLEAGQGLPGTSVAEVDPSDHVLRASGRYIAYRLPDQRAEVRDLDTHQVVLDQPHPDPSNPQIALTGDTLWETAGTPGSVRAVDVRSGATRQSLEVADCDLTDLQVNGSLLYWKCDAKAGVRDLVSGANIAVSAHDTALLGDGYLAHQQDGVLSVTPLRGAGTTRVVGNPSKAGINFTVDRFGGPLAYADDQDRVHVVRSGVPASDLTTLDSDTPETLDLDTTTASWTGRWWLSKPAVSWTLTVKDRAGNTVRTQGAGETRGLVKAAWVGKDDNGAALADGRYTYDLTALPADGTGPQLHRTGEVFLTHGRLGTYEPVSPARILDTRSGLGAPKAKVGPGGTVTLQVTGRGGVPATGVTAITMNVTATNPNASTYVSVYPYGTPRSAASSLNAAAGRTVPNLVTVPVKDGKVTLYNHAGTTDLLADVAGYHTLSGEGDRFRSVTPGRVLDTRSGLGAPKAEIGSAQTVTLQVAGRGGVPATGVTAITMNVTATNPTASTYVSVYPYGTPRSAASNLNMVAGQTVANLVTVPVKDGKVTLYNHAGTTDLLADVAGYFTSGAGDRFRSVTPARLLDTRSGLGAPKAKIGSAQTVTLQVTGRGGVPATGVTAITMNVTATNPTSVGYVSVCPYGTPRPATSNLNVVNGQTVANQVVVPVKDGKVTLYNHSGTIDLLADVAGYYTS
ncbi:FlgD immunoglobulin-like domain containing protein [Streptomyces sp. NPDC049915]|uniref:FlgD immunoglobulin-like domain containing protein n=1 Tax=Streptomyces sp. NPDC049915 TaxID=3155510 RepID=UPI00343F1F8E